MNFLIADTFTASLGRLMADEMKAAKMAAFDLQMNPAAPGLSFHQVERSRDKNFYSARVGLDLRLIVHRTENSLLLCYVDHHDKAYAWAERRRLETHPKTGAAQIVEIRETVKEIVVPRYVQAEVPVHSPERPALFAAISDKDLLNLGVPEEWIKDVRNANEDTLLDLAEHLPAEAAEGLLALATGGTPPISVSSEATVAIDRVDPVAAFQHPDAKRRFKVIATTAELQQALEFSWDRWTVFLHPDQRLLAERDFNGPARVAGSAGTGKTVVALHRAAYLARAHPDSRVLLGTFSRTLASALHSKLQRLIASEPSLGERIDVCSLDEVGLRLHKTLVGPTEIVGRQALRALIRSAAEAVSGHKFTQQFLVSEWDHVVDAWQLASWEDYRDVQRLGRKTRLPEAQRELLWRIFEQVRTRLSEMKAKTLASIFTAVAEALKSAKNLPYQFAVIDEAQDLSVAQLRMLAALGSMRGNGLFFAGDLGQRIFQQPFSWKALGVNVRGRSKTLRVNYRTSHQIRARADRLLPAEVNDVDGNSEARRGTVSVFNGPDPLILSCPDEAGECRTVAEWLIDRTAEGVLPHEIGVFVRSAAQVPRARTVLQAAGLPFQILDEQVVTATGHASLCTMHLAKGLEFRAVAVMACDDEVIPLQERIEAVGDEGDLEEVYDTERYLLYVACTRARDALLVTGVEPTSEFLDDFR